MEGDIELNVTMIFLSLLALAVVVFLCFIKYVYSYWKRKGYPYLKPSIPFGNLVTFQKKEQSFSISAADLYNKTNEPFVGIYLFFRPALLIRDADLVKKILCDEFPSFYDRGIHCNEKLSPLSANLFHLEGKKWKYMRSIVSPTFTSGKLKKMFETIENVGNIMEQYLIDITAKEGTVIELKELATKYATDIIVSTFCGVETNSFKDNTHIFSQILNDLNSKGFLRNLTGATVFLAPKLYEWLQLYRTDAWISQNLIKIVEDTIDYREKTNSERKDFLQLLIQLRNTGTINDDDDWSTNSNNRDEKTLTITQIAAQIFIFFVAGLETTSSAISFCLYELTQNDHVLQKLIEDIDQTLKKHNGQFTYDSIQDMKYLDLVLMETFRKYPGLPFLNRICTKDFPIPDSNFTIEKGTAIIISMLGLQRDPQYFTDPLKFDPDRFSEENRNYNPNAYIPFGDGPRTCIGLRQGKLSVKVAVVKILTKFKLEARERKELEFDNYSVGLKAKGGVNILLKKI